PCRLESTRASRQRYDVCLLSLFMGDELFRVSLVDAGESQNAESSQRRWQHAQLHAVQLPGFARRHFHAWPRWDSDGKSHRACALVIGDSGEFAKPESRMDLFAAADDIGRGFCRAEFQYARSAHGSLDGNERVQRLPRV